MYVGRVWRPAGEVARLMEQLDESHGAAASTAVSDMVAPTVGIAPPTEDVAAAETLQQMSRQYPFRNFEHRRLNYRGSTSVRQIRSGATLLPASIRPTDAAQGSTIPDVSTTNRRERVKPRASFRAPRSAGKKRRATAARRGRPPKKQTLEAAKPDIVPPPPPTLSLPATITRAKIVTMSEARNLHTCEVCGICLHLLKVPGHFFEQHPGTPVPALTQWMVQVLRDGV